MTWIIAKLVLGGVPQRFAKALAYLGAIIAAIAFLWGLKAIYDRSIVREHEAEREAAAAPAREAASNQRAADTVTNATNEKDLHNAIDQAPKGGQLSPAALALNCERLRKAGRVPPACGRSSSDGSQAPAK